MASCRFADQAQLARHMSMFCFGEGQIQKEDITNVFKNRSLQSPNSCACTRGSRSKWVRVAGVRRPAGRASQE